MAHKGDFGHLLVVGGDHGMSGALRLAGEASLRTGAGLISAATRADHAAIVLDVDIEHPLQASPQGAYFCCTPVIEARRSADVGVSSDTLAVLPLPRFAGVTRARCLLLGAKTPWKRVRLALGQGHIIVGRIAHFQVKLKIGFRLD